MDCLQRPAAHLRGARPRRRRCRRRSPRPRRTAATAPSARAFVRALLAVQRAPLPAPAGGPRRPHHGGGARGGGRAAATAASSRGSSPSTPRSRRRRTTAPRRVRDRRACPAASSWSELVRARLAPAQPQAISWRGPLPRLFCSSPRRSARCRRARHPGPTATGDAIDGRYRQAESAPRRLEAAARRRQTTWLPSRAAARGGARPRARVHHGRWRGLSADRTAAVGVDDIDAGRKRLHALVAATRRRAATRDACSGPTSATPVYVEGDSDELLAFERVTRSYGGRVYVLQSRTDRRVRRVAVAARGHRAADVSRRLAHVRPRMAPTTRHDGLPAPQLAPRRGRLRGRARTRRRPTLLAGEPELDVVGAAAASADRPLEDQHRVAEGQEAVALAPSPRRTRA